MEKIEIKQNKKLKLKNVINKNLNNFDLQILVTEISKFTNEINLLKIQTFGLLIIRNGGVQISDNGSVKSNYDLYI